MSKPELFDSPLSRATVERLAQESFEDMVKFVVDLKRKKIAVGGGMHSDEEALLLRDGSEQADLWGANYYLHDKSEQRFEYTSMINIRPSQNNLAQLISDPGIRQAVREMASHFFESAV